MKKQKKIKAAIIGLGRIGAQKGNWKKSLSPFTHAQGYSSHKKFELVALVDSDSKKISTAKKIYPNALFYSSVKKMLKEQNPDIVSVCSPTQTHKKFVLEPALCNTPVIFCEKPIAYTLKDAKQMINACKKSKSKLFINHQRHFDPLVQKWTQKIRKGKLGKVYQAHAYYNHGLFNNGTHIIDLLMMMFGKPEKVVARTNNKTSINKEDKNVDGLLIFKNDLVVSLHSFPKNYSQFGVSVFTDKGMVNFSDFAVEYREKVESIDYKGEYQISSQIQTEGKQHSTILDTLDHIVACVEKGTKPISTGEDALEVLKVLIDLKNNRM
jgi:predicted dehydrogenase